MGFVGATAVALPGVFALLKAKSELTDAGKEALEQGLARLGIPQNWREGTKFGLTLLVAAFMLGIWGTLPWFSQEYNQWGRENYDQKHPQKKEQAFLTAISLDSDNLNAHYNLGYLYEDLQDFDSARKQYQLAAKGGHPEASNNLARLSIRDKTTRKQSIC